MFCFNALKSSTLFNQIILNNIEKHGFTGLSPTLLNIFAYLAENDNISVSTLANALGVSRQAMHKNINKLVEMDYITLKMRPKNRKEKIVILTKLGQELIQLSLNVINMTEKKMAEYIGEQEYQKYLKLQQQLTTFLENIESKR